MLQDSHPFRPVIQFSIHADNKVGRLNEIISLLSVHEVHVMALSILDTTDSSIIRLIVDYPEEAQNLLVQHNFSYVQSGLIAVEIDDESMLKIVTTALVQAEINIHSSTPSLFVPMGATP